ncbi:hypothetical protein Cme02nite_66160 [Catellatospora methionotrophica]|uniref:GntR family transcriptional regulator n=1 Tax=Catellatospora methionotrophica TaxID=121620 RepID=A0A8J3LGA4_9ACTN|nr:hypothetical protein [Catellatospora methionotrophica]GIG18284.1 hypothetical protein Cme02nite_66160 [Catellatospora methionotrophica]
METAYRFLSNDRPIQVSRSAMVIERTHLAGDLAVEACDIVFPSERYELTYVIPVAPQPR